ncbi:head maturation protease, ClpP-related [uncultured Robinsoniella sp.]|uniref:head maturation protease, ClpP-related n=1 Tax=uncultured Robinsoniella sp. TaxID=904190 RepID=UPI002913A1E2|nr:Clp protease ClpP [Clostridiales bacterium]
MAKIDVRGDIIGNDDKWLYDWYGFEATCPKDIVDTIESSKPGEEIEVYINSGGGDIFAGQEIYSVLRGKENVTIIINSLAGSAAGVIAMAGKSKISPVAMIMVHNVSAYGVSGDYHSMDKYAEMLKTANAALAAAFEQKTGMQQNEVLEMMDKETWIDAKTALSMGLVDEIIEEKVEFTNCLGSKITKEMRQQAVEEKNKIEASKRKKEELKNEILGDLDLFGI